MRRASLALPLLALLVALLAPGLVSAQRVRYGMRPRPRSAYYSPGHRASPWSALVFVGFLGLVGGGLFVRGSVLPWWRRARDGRRLRTGDMLDLTLVRLVVDARARTYAEQKITEVTAGADVATPAGAHALLTATARALLDLELAWLRAEVVNYPPQPRARATAELDRLLLSEHTGHAHEIVREPGGPYRVVSIEPMTLSRPHDDAPVTMITLVVLARMEICDVWGGDAEALSKLLAALAAAPPESIVALEIAWTPESPEKTVTAAELARRHVLLAEIGNVLGRVFCETCGRPHRYGLEKCPFCGA